MTSNFKFTFIQDNTKTTLIVRKNLKNPNIHTNYNPILNTLELLGLEKVPYKELVPCYKQIKKDDCLVGQLCAICHDDFKLREYKRELTCDHTFHKRCIDKWLKNNLSCPMCRKDIGNLGSTKEAFLLNN